MQDAIEFSFIVHAAAEQRLSMLFGERRVAWVKARPMPQTPLALTLANASYSLRRSVEAHSADLARGEGEPHDRDRSLT